MLMNRCFHVLSFATLMLLTITIQTIAQTTGECPPLVELALDALGQNCASLDNNNACYGYQQVDSTFTFDVGADYFNTPSDRADLTTVQTIRTSPLDELIEQWGIAVMNVQANVPNTAPGQAVTFVMLGDAAVENQVDSTSVPPEVDPITVRLQQSTPIRSNPTNASNAIATIEAGVTFDTDAISRDAEWLRVLVDGRAGWLSREAIIPDPTLDNLPIFTVATRTPMQSFYFSTGFGEPACNEAPNIIGVRSPENLQVDLTVNGVDIRIGSTISFMNLDSEHIMMMVHEGSLLTVDGQAIGEDEALIATTATDGSILSWETLRPMTDSEQEYGDVIMAVMDALRDDTVVTLPSPVIDNTTYTVAIGDTLFSIARRYNANMQDIMDASGIGDPNTIVPGQVLTIPGAGSGFVGVQVPDTPPTGNTPTTDPTGGVDCTGFRASSPLDGLGNGFTTFFWDAPATAVDSYRLFVYNLETGRSTTQNVSAPTTTATIDVSVNALGAGFDFAWEVQALRNREVVCNSVRTTLQRAAITVAPPPTVPFTAGWTCVTAGTVQISWNNAPAGDTITINLNDSVGSPVTLTGFTGASGSTTFLDVLVTGGVVSTSSGATFTLSPPSLAC